MTSDIDLRGKGLGARQGLGVKEHKINISLERISELFDTGHQSLASNLLKNRNNTSLELNGLILAAERRSFFRMNEFAADLPAALSRKLNGIGTGSG